MSKDIHVAVAVVVVNDQDVLIAKRSDDKHQGGLWEFPGGKVEAGEAVNQALIRELDEEVALPIKDEQLSPFMQVRHQYDDKTVLLDVIWVESNIHDAILAHGAEGQEVRWAPYFRLNEFEFPDANKTILEAVVEKLKSVN